MRKILSVVLILAMLLVPCTTAYAAGNFISRVGSNYTVVTKTVRTRSGTVSLTGYSHTAEALEVFRIINVERAAAGLKGLTWESDLVQPAIQRAFEQEYEKSHTRSDGSEWYTVHEKANGENLAGGDISAADVMVGWMNSPDHRENILDEDFTSVAVACVETESMCYWVQLFHIGSGKDSAGTVSSSGTVGSGGSSTAAVNRSANVSSDGSVSAANAVADLAAAKSSAGNTTSVTVRNADKISPAVLKSLKDWGTSNAKTVSLVANTTFDDQNSVQGQMAINPANFADRKEDLLLGVRVDSASTSSVRGIFNGWYANQVVVVKMDQAGALGASVQVAVRADLTGLNANSLMFYAYDKAANTISTIANPGYSVDRNGYLHFNTSSGGYIIITDKALVRR